ncbi:MAG: coproporphyrinogen-III oxidase family protein, partial [Bacteroidia bacterium]
LTVKEVSKMLDTVRDNFAIEKNAEITFELNPEDATLEYLSAIRSAGVNRLSIGLQSFNNEELKWMNRAHSAQQSVDCVASAKKAGFENISIDLIYGSRFQNEESWRATLQKVFELNVPHISSYNLTIEGKTKLNHLLQQKAEPEVDSALSAKLFDILMQETAKHGYEHYEISNFCKPGFMAVHNSSYWKGAHYSGVGPAAHSYNGVSRSFNVKSNSQYLHNIESGKQFWEEEQLSDQDKYNEYILTRLRTSWGCDRNEMEKMFDKKFIEHFKNKLNEHKEHIIISKGVVTLNQAGKHFADGIAADLFY